MEPGCNKRAEYYRGVGVEVEVKVWGPFDRQWLGYCDLYAYVIAPFGFLSQNRFLCELMGGFWILNGNKS